MESVIRREGGTWEKFSCSSTIGSAEGYVNKTLRLAIVVYQSGGDGKGDGSINISNAPPIYGDIYASLRYGGYLRTFASNNVISIVSAAAWDVGEIIYPIK